MRRRRPTRGELVASTDEDVQHRHVAERDERHVDVDVAGRGLDEHLEVIPERLDGRQVELAADVEPGPATGVRDEQAECFGQVRHRWPHEGLELSWHPGC